ncbi:MAG: PQQ-binding-like beta-propeller repeat protein [Acidobacteria bacterium]|nr:PQQ-binding-like beta-propeller repeat protein [Acidobacteriota bacterium]
MKVAVLLLCVLCFFGADSHAQSAWQTNLDSTIRFYQTTDFGIVLAGTERSLYAVDGKTGQQIWRRATGRIEQTAVTPIPDTDVILFTRDEGSKSRLEAVDVLTGSRLWQSEKVKGDVMQLAVDPENDLIAVVMVKDPRGKADDSFKKKPTVHVLQLSTGNELWKRDLDNSIEMMPTRFGEDLGDIDYTLDNYRAPLLLDGRLFLFYEGSTSYEARTGKEKEREKFKINEDGLALTEADPVFDESHVYVSGKGKIRAVDRRTGKQDWEADDLGICAEMALVGNTLFVRTGGRFTQLKDGELKEKGPFGVSAINTTNGKTLWRYKGADKGLTNFVFADANTILIADKDDLITLDATNGKRIAKRNHKIDKAQFVLINESGHAVVGGRNEIAAFDVKDQKVREYWRSRHTAPARGVLRVVSGIALRAAALYFRYGGIATSALGLARTGISIASAANSFRWSGLQTRFGSVSLSTLAGNSARNYALRRIYAYGSLGRTPNLINRFSGLSVAIPNATDLRGQIIGRAIDRVTPTRADVQESIFDRLDPVRQVERFSDFILRRKRLAELRLNHMFFYTDLPKPFDKKGLVGVNIHSGKDARLILASDPDVQFVTDETLNLLYTASGSRLQAFDILGR